MSAMNIDSAFLKEYQKKLERKMRENEMQVVQYWKDRLGKVISMKPEGIASLQLEIRKIFDMMGNRIGMLKKELK